MNTPTRAPTTEPDVLLGAECAAADDRYHAAAVTAGMLDHASVRPHVETEIHVDDVRRDESKRGGEGCAPVGTVPCWWGLSFGLFRGGARWRGCGRWMWAVILTKCHLELGINVREVISYSHECR